MSRTPETFTDKKAESRQGNLIFMGIVAGLLSWGFFANDAVGLGLIAGGISALLVVIGFKIKTTYYKQAEAAAYRKR